MNRKAQVLTVIAAISFNILIWARVVHPQAATQTPPPAAPAAAGQRGMPGTESGLATFQTRCSVCHNNPVQGAQTASEIREMTTERIYSSLVTGSMQKYTEGLSDIQKRRLAEFMSGRPLGSAKAGSGENMPNRCRENPALANPAGNPAWSGVTRVFSPHRPRV